VRYDLGLGDEEFWRLTPRQYSALVERLEEQKRWESWQTGLICSTLANIFAKKGHRLKPEDFMPRFPKKPKSWKEQLVIVERLNVFFGGVDRRRDKKKCE